jgi:hypothetical protein
MRYDRVLLNLYPLPIILGHSVWFCANLLGGWDSYLINRNPLTSKRHFVAGTQICLNLCAFSSPSTQVLACTQNLSWIFLEKVSRSSPPLQNPQACICVQINPSSPLAKSCMRFSLLSPYWVQICFPRYLFKHPSCSFDLRDQVSFPYKTRGKVTVSYVVIVPSLGKVWGRFWELNR